MALRVLSYIGLISYSIYLLHPVMLLTADLLIPHWPVVARLAACVIATFVMSIATYHLIEKPFMVLGKILPLHPSESKPVSI